MKPSLNLTEKSIVSYIAGYVVRKTRHLSHMLPGGVGQQTPTMTFPNLKTQSLTRGGLMQVDQAIFNFFCYLEVSIRPFLNLSHFRSGNLTLNF